MKLTDNEVAKLSALPHTRGCKWYDDGDWNSSTFANYFNAYGEYPECTCGAIAAAPPPTQRSR